MNKRKIILTALAFACGLASNAQTVVVKGKDVEPKGNSVVTSNGQDTIVVTPGVLTDTISITVKDSNGSTCQSYEVPTSSESMTIDMPQQPSGYMVELRDENGIIYEYYY